MASWDANGGSDMLLASRRVHIIDDLLGAVLLLAVGLFVVSLELTRRQICAVYQLAFALCASWALFIVGGLVDHHVTDGQLSLALYGSYLSNTSYIYLPILTSVLVSLAFVLHLSTCTSCDCCCLVGDASKVSNHRACFEARIRAHGSLYVACFVALFVAIGTRLNVRLRGSAINPIGGTVHWTVLRSPFYLSVIHVSTLVLIALKLFLQHADKRTFHDPEHFQRLSHSLSTQSGHIMSTQAAPVTTVDDLMRPPPLKKVPPSPRRSIEGKTTVSHSPRSTSSLPSAAILKAEPTKSAPSTESARRVPLHKGPSSAHSQQQQQQRKTDDGDMSSLISSDSENDDDVLLPSFKGANNPHLPPLHQQLNSKSQPSHRPSSSGYASSPPASPISTASSSSSAFSFSSATVNARQRMRSARPRSSSNVSSTSTNPLSVAGSDSEDPAFDSSSYYSDRPSSASSAASYGLRKRAATQNLDVTTVPVPVVMLQSSEWLECFDPATGSAYYYNQRTDESRWGR